MPCFRLALVFIEEGFVRTQNFLALLEPPAQTMAEIDNPIHPVCRKECVASDGERLLTDAINTACALDEPDDGPRQIEIHECTCGLQVQALTRGVSAKTLIVPVRRAAVTASFDAATHPLPERKAPPSPE